MNLAFRRRRTLSFITLLLATTAAAVWIPITTVTVPEWTVQVVDAAGRPVNGACVSQSWLQYSFEMGTGHDEEAKADANGRVTFARRTATATVLQRVVRPLKQLGTLHASYGAHSWINAWAPYQAGSVLYDAQVALPAKVILRRETVQFEWDKGSIAARCSPIQTSP